MKMTIQAEIYPPMLPSRPCRFCLCLQGGSAFADFDVDENDNVFLLRISFDGYGCCDMEGKTAVMSREESSDLTRMIESGRIDAAKVNDILKGFFQRYRELIWNDALQEWKLIQ